MAIWNRLYFPAFPAPSWSHVTKFWPMGSNWKWDMKLPVNILKNKGLVLPLFARWSSYFGLWCGSFTLRMAEQQNRRSLGSLARWNHHHQSYYTHIAFTRDRQNSTLFTPFSFWVFNHSQLNPNPKWHSYEGKMKGLMRDYNRNCWFWQEERVSEIGPLRK